LSTCRRLRILPYRGRPVRCYVNPLRTISASGELNS
jgi:hypothetical protein